MTIQPALTDVPETLLWTLYNRANEAKKPNSGFNDPKCIEIYESIDYDYKRSFGSPHPSHSSRAIIFDQAIKDFLSENPDGLIINLAEGLETQRYRIDAPYATWYSIDLPSAIEIREKFISPDEQHIHIPKSALDTSWFNQVPENKRAIITAQGLFMYFREEELAVFLKELAERFPGSILMFDFIPPWLSKRTVDEKGWMKTKHYRTPPMPWGIKQNDIEPTLSKWIGKDIKATFEPFKYNDNFYRLTSAILYGLSFIRNRMPGMCSITLPE